MPRIRLASGTTLDVSNGWCVAQVHLRRRLGADSTLDAISRRMHIPAPVLEPAFRTAYEDGYLTGDQEGLRLTDKGQREIEKIVVKTREWLAAELSDWGAADDEVLTKALTNMATQFVDEDPQLQLQATASAGQP